MNIFSPSAKRHAFSMLKDAWRRITPLRPAQKLHEGQDFNLQKNVNEGHGFSRAVKTGLLRALAPEVRFLISDLDSSLNSGKFQLPYEPVPPTTTESCG
jgi:hypothetical protein